MVISAGNGNNAVSAKDNTVRLLIPPQQDHYAEQRVKLAQVLQTTLDLNTLLELFFKQLQETVSLDGLSYGKDQGALSIAVGSECSQKVNYRLNIGQLEMGEITFSRRTRFIETEMAAIESMITTLIFPLRNALQYREAVISSLQDPLTGIGNRNALINTLEREIQLSKRHQHPLSMLIIDVDHFKCVNDTYGHATGDEVLKTLAATIQSAARQYDLVFRYGGEEFVVLLNKTSNTGASVIAERIRQEIENLSIDTGTEVIQVSVSIGVSSLHQDEDSNELFRRADAALYQAKNKGRNRIVCID